MRRPANRRSQSETTAERGSSACQWRSALSTITLLAVLAVGLGGALPSFQGGAAPKRMVTVTILEVEALDCLDSDLDCDRFDRRAADFYPKITIDGSPEEARRKCNDQHLTPDEIGDWVFEQRTTSDAPSVTIEISEKDEKRDCDAPIILDTEDGMADIDPGGGGEEPDGRALDLTINVDASGCRITDPGDAGGLDVDAPCGSVIETTGDFKDDQTRIRFRVSVARTDVSDLGVRCLHTPLWPQRGDTVTINVNALDGNNNLVMGADTIRVETSKDNTTCNSQATCQASVDATSDQLDYRCVVEHDGDEVETHGDARASWRHVQVGLPDTGDAIPVVINGRTSGTGNFANQIDIVFFPHQSSYTGPRGNQFLTDVYNGIWRTYYDGHASLNSEKWLDNQHLFNFWIANDTASGTGATPVMNPSSCNLQLPADWSEDYGFADTQAIVHAGAITRDCATMANGTFSTNGGTTGGADTGLVSPPAPTLNTFIHEVGHSVFSLADEYCCDGGYTVSGRFPNVYGSQSDCQGDDAFVPGSGMCQQIRNSTTRTGFFRLDPASTLGNDLMVGRGNHTDQTADTRAMDWIFEQCSSGGKKC